MYSIQHDDSSESAQQGRRPLFMYFGTPEFERGLLITALVSVGLALMTGLAATLMSLG